MSLIIRKTVDAAILDNCIYVVASDCFLYQSLPAPNLYFHTIDFPEKPAAAPVAKKAPVDGKLFFVSEPQSSTVIESKPTFQKILFLVCVISDIRCWPLSLQPLTAVFYTKFSSPESTATFIAKVGGDPIPNVKWMKGKWRQLNQGGRISIQQKGEEAKLEIKDATKTDSGHYRCVAFNKHGEIESNVNLQVEERRQEVIEGDLRAKLKK